MTPTKLALGLIRPDFDMQPRAEIDSGLVKEYAEAMLGGADFPAAIVFYDGKVYWLADGYHRYYASKAAGLAQMLVKATEGTRRDAILYSVGANADHGKRRTNADKRKAVETLLKDPEWVKWNDSKIARQARVTHPFVGSVRAELLCNRYTIAPERLVERNGTVYTYTRNPEPANATPDLFTTEPEEEPEATALPVFVPEPEPEPEPPAPTAPALVPEAAPPPRPQPEPEMVSTPELAPASMLEPEPALSSPPAPVTAPAPPVTTFNRTNRNVDWAWWTWNPVTGCKTGCPYCYARDIALSERTGKAFPNGFEPTFRPERLGAPGNTAVPVLPTDAPLEDRIGSGTVFVCSMADLFGPWVPQEWIDAVLQAVRGAPQWRFLFLSKYPARLATIRWPDNAWVGTTVDTQARVKSAEDAFRNVNARVRFLSCEPLRERIVFSDLSMFDWLIIGGQSQSSGEPAKHPEWEWLNGLQRQAEQAGVETYWKPNLENKVRPRGYPKG